MRFALLFAAALVVLVSGRGEAEPDGLERLALAVGEGTAERAEGSSHAYSPFLVDVAGVEAFDLISFKDVGLHLDDPDTYELLAESLAMSLADHPAMSFDTSLHRDDQYTDPAYHLACGTAHIYVDVWRSSEPSRWGYSLWSGCGEESQFAWEELPMTVPIASDVALAMQPLTDAIASSLGEAVATGCYERSC